MSRSVGVRRSYVADLVEALPLRFVDFLADVHPVIVAEASESFPGPAPAEVDPEHDVAEIRGTWLAGQCDYFAIAQLRLDGSVDLITIDFDLDPLPQIDD
ncbi:MAG: hypothetical protein GY925_30465 [Actinomycetia bacterium]|nr:hypothetical protein [Actinomycetes bacterium]